MCASSAAVVGAKKTFDKPGVERIEPEWVCCPGFGWGLENELFRPAKLGYRFERRHRQDLGSLHGQKVGQTGALQHSRDGARHRRPGSTKMTSILAGPA